MELLAGPAEVNGSSANPLPTDTARRLRSDQRRTRARIARLKPLCPLPVVIELMVRTQRRMSSTRTCRKIQRLEA
jgi:hypothetical protein